jgi:hypothetical protein
MGRQPSSSARCPGATWTHPRPLCHIIHPAHRATSPRQPKYAATHLAVRCSCLEDSTTRPPIHTASCASCAQRYVRQSASSAATPPAVGQANGPGVSEHLWIQASIQTIQLVNIPCCKRKPLARARGAQFFQRTGDQPLRRVGGGVCAVGRKRSRRLSGPADVSLCLGGVPVGSLHCHHSHAHHPSCSHRQACPSCPRALSQASARPSASVWPRAPGDPPHRSSRNARQLLVAPPPCSHINVGAPEQLLLPSAPRSSTSLASKCRTEEQPRCSHSRPAPPPPRTCRWKRCANF